MQVQNLKMYHFHKSGVYDEMWKEGSKFIVDKDFYSYYCNIVNGFQTGILAQGSENVSFARVLSFYLKNPEVMFEEPGLFMNLLAKSKEIILGMDAFQREFVLESYRRNYYPKLPSRKHSIWVTNKESLEYWKLMLESSDYQLSLLELDLTGELIKTSALFLPEEGFSMNETYSKCEAYWNPIFKNKEEEQQAEYLFQGEVKVLKKLS